MPENIGNLSFSFAFPQKFCDLYNEYRDDPLKLEMLNVEGIAPDNMDIPVQSKKFFKGKVSDTSIDANANANSDDRDSKNPASYAAELDKGSLKLEGYYLLWRELEKLYGENRASDLLRHVWDGDLYVHDASGAMIQTYYCYAYSTQKIMYEGRPWGQLHSVAPKRADSFIAQVTESTMDFSQNQAGAVAVTDILVNFAYYSKKENLSDQKITNELQKFVHVMNNKFRTSFQSPFCNISLFDRNNLRVLFDGYTYPDFTPVDVEYVMHVQKIFLNFFSKGDPTTKLPYRFPVVTATYLNDPKNGYELDKDFLMALCEATFKNGATNIYISNDMGKIASCCRLINDFKLLKGGDSFGNGGQIGSHRVVTVNLPAIALFANKDTDKFKTLLGERLQDAHDILKAHRSLLHKRANLGFIPFINRGYINIDSQLFSTVGLNGIYEAMLFLTGEKMHEHEATKEFAKDIFKTIKETSYRWIDEEGLPYNIEQVPAESLAPKNAYKDALRFGADAQPFPLYSNQFIPLWTDVDVHTRARLDGEFSKSLTGGGITHFNMDQPFNTPEEMYNSVLYNIEVGNEHFAYNFNRQICDRGHVTIGHNRNICTECGGKIVDGYTRIVGYFVPTSSWNKVRREYEHAARVFK